VEFQLNREAERLTLALSGTLDRSAVEALHRHLQRIGADKTREVVLDLARVDFLGTSALAALLRFFQDSESAGRRVRFINVNHDLRALFGAVGLDRRLGIA